MSQKSLVYNREKECLDLNQAESEIVGYLMKDHPIKHERILKEYFDKFKSKEEKLLAWQRLDEIFSFYYRPPYQVRPPIGQPLLDPIFAIMAKIEISILNKSKVGKARPPVVYDLSLITNNEAGFKTAFKNILNEKFKTKTQRIMQSVLFILETNPSLGNRTALSKLIFDEFGTELELKINPLRKVLAEEKLAGIVVNKKIKDYLEPLLIKG